MKKKQKKKKKKNEYLYSALQKDPPSGYINMETHRRKQPYVKAYIPAQGRSWLFTGYSITQFTCQQDGPPYKRCQRQGHVAASLMIRCLLCC